MITCNIDHRTKAYNTLVFHIIFVLRLFIGIAYLYDLSQVKVNFITVILLMDMKQAIW